MTDFLYDVTAWLTDYYAAATILLVMIGITRALLRQPVQRMVLAWATLAGLAVTGLLCAISPWPRMTLRPIQAPSRADAQVAHTSSHIDLPRTGSVQSRLPPTSSGSSSPPSERELPPQISRPEVVRAPRHTFPRLDLRILLASGFLAGSILVIGWEVLGLIRVRRLRCSSIPAPEHACRELLALVPANAQPPVLLVSQRLASAVAFGMWRPVIVLPDTAVRTDDSDASRLSALLAHELAHVRRGDLWLLGLARFLLIVLYAHPVFWWLKRQVGRDQELLADAVAAQVCGRQSYAESLVIWARQLPPPRLAGVMGIVFEKSSQQLTRRIAMLLNERNLVHTQTSCRWYLGAALTLIPVVAALSLVTLRPALAVRAAEPPEIKQVSASSQPPAQTVPVDTQHGSHEQPAKSKRRGWLDVDGVCLDEQKQPVADVRLLLFYVSYDDGTQQELQEIHSDADGRFRFAPINAGQLFAVAWHETLKYLVNSPNRRLVVIAQKPGRATVTRLIASDKPSSRTLEIEMLPAKSLRGRIVDEADQPIAGATVTIQSLRPFSPGILSAVTDADGRYEIADATEWDQDAEEKARNANRHAVRGTDLTETVSRGAGVLRHPDFADVVFRYESIPATQDFRLSHPASLEGRVTFQDTGKPAGKVAVQVIFDRSSAPAAGQTVTTDAEGRYAIQSKLQPRKCEIEARLDGWPKVLVRDIPLRSGKNVVDLQVQEGGIIKGKIIELSTGKPPVAPPGSFNLLQAANVADRTNQEHIALSHDGNFELRVLPGKTMFIVSTLHIAGGVSHDQVRWILVGNDRQPAQVVEVAKGATKQVEIRLLRQSAELDEWMDGGDELRSKMERLLEPSTEKRTDSGANSNLTEQAAVAAIKQLGGSIKTEVIDGRECVVEVNMAYSKLAGNPDESTVENELFTDEALFYLPKFRYLKTLELARGQASDKGLQSLRGMEHLESVCLMDAWGITDAGLAPLATLPNLKRFCTHRAEQLTDVALQHLAQAPSLSEIFLHGGRFSNSGLKHLQRLKHLKILEIASSEALITDAGLAALAGHSDLEMLGLENTKLTDGGLKSLHGLKNLTELDVDQSAVTPEGLDALRKVLSKLKAPEANKAHGHQHD